MPPATEVLTSDDPMASTRPRRQRVVLFDYGHYYMGGVRAELLSKDGILTPAPPVSAWTVNTMEILKIRRRTHQAGVTLCCNNTFDSVAADHVVGVNIVTEEQFEMTADSVAMVTSRLPRDSPAARAKQRLRQVGDDPLRDR
jgi:dimethylamine/trimethylamine dehydrogenase